MESQQGVWWVFILLNLTQQITVQKALLLVLFLKYCLATPGQIHGDYTNHTDRLLEKSPQPFLLIFSNWLLKRGISKHLTNIQILKDPIRELVSKNLIKQRIKEINPC